MKKILSCLLCAAMLASSVATTVIAADDPVIDKAMLLDDISIPNSQETGSYGYIVNTNKDVKNPDGVSVAFDFNMISSTPCSHIVQTNSPTWRHQSALVFSFGSTDGGHNAIVYDAVRQEFQIGIAPWPRGGCNPNMSHVLKRKKYEMNPGDWHRIFCSIQGNEVFLYVDGVEILKHDFRGGANGNLTHSFLMFWPTHIRCMLDNLVVGNDEFIDGDDTAENKANILYEADFNDATAPVYDHTVEDVPTWEVAKDVNGNELSDDEGNPIYVQDTDENGNLLVDENGDPVWKQAVDDKGNPVTHSEYYYKVGDEVIKGASQKHAGFSFDNFGEAVPYKGVDKATYSGMVKESADAVISVEDTTGVEGETFTAAINYDPSKGAITSAKNLVLAYDPIFDSAKIDNVADGVSVTLHDGNLVDITIPADFNGGRLADLVLTVPEENEMAQSGQYRYGFIVGANTTFTDAAGAAIADTDKLLDGAMANTKNYILGDANGDGRVNAKDIAIILYYIAQSKDKNFNEKTFKTDYPKLKTFNKRAANFRADSDLINSRDVIELMQHIVSLPFETK